jgi:NaMN:DMB phosphoribosyltransferase
MNLDPLLEAINSRLAEIEAQKPPTAEDVLALIEKFKAHRAAGIPIKPRPPDTPEEARQK